jgi:DNA mismatch endonuclease (patch repair protein)
MADHLTAQERSAFMARIRGRDTKPELVVRRLLHALGYRFRLHHKALPGKPDVAFTKRRKAIFVHGCFWHGHDGCAFSHVPKTRPDYWSAKFQVNRARDARNLADLKSCGWDAVVVWECELRDETELTARLSTFLGPRKCEPNQGPGGMNPNTSGCRPTRPAANAEVEVVDCPDHE